MKPSDKTWKPRCTKMVALLAKKLTVDEFKEFFVLYTEDPPGGPFLDATAAKAMELFPELFSELNENEIVEVDQLKGEQDFPTIKE